MKNVFAILVAFSLLVVPAYADEVTITESVSPVEEAAEPVLEVEVQPVVPVDGSDLGSDVIDDSASTGDPEPVISMTVDELAEAIALANAPEVELFTLVDDTVQGGCFMDVETSAGDMLIYIPTDYQYGSFSYFGSNVTGIRSSTITGYFFRNSDLYQVRFQPFSIPQYRNADSGYTYTDFDITNVNDTNIQILDSFDELPLFVDDGYMKYMTLFILGVIAVCLFMKRW